MNPVSVKHIDQHPIPKAEELFTTLAGGKKFSKLDFSQAGRHTNRCRPGIGTLQSTLSVHLACEASRYALDAVISHLMPDGTEYPIAYGSRTLTKAEKIYTQIEREAATIIFGIKKFYPCIDIYGSYINNRSQTIFTPKSSGCYSTVTSLHLWNWPGQPCMHAWHCLHLDFWVLSWKLRIYIPYI